MVENDFRNAPGFTPEQQQLFNRILMAGLLIGVGIWLGSVIFSGDQVGYATNIYTELLSIGVTIGILNYLSERREERRKINDLKEQLVRQAGSTSNETAKDAIYQLRKRKWLRGANSLLKGEDLQRANLSGSDLRVANLNDANLVEVVLIDADLSKASLKQAYLTEADLTHAEMRGVNLTGAELLMANLEGAILWGARLADANLALANLANADLMGAVFSEKTNLPDRTKWTPETDMTRFTDPNHAQFWRSDFYKSPAYRKPDEPATS